MKFSWFTRVVLSLVSGVLLAMAYPTFNLPILAWFAVALLMISALGASLRSAALLGLLHGAAFALLSMSWIYTVLRVHGNADVLSAAGAMAAFTFVLALFPMAFVLLCARIGKRGVARACLAAPFLWVALEFVKTHLPYIGFPWNLLGYPAAINLLLLQITTWTGIWGLSLLVAAYNSLLAWALVGGGNQIARDVYIRDRYFVVRYSARAWITLGAATLGLAITIPFGALLVPKPSAHHTARLVQLNFPEVPEYPPDWMTIHGAEMDDLERLSDARGEKPFELIVWPEVPAPFSTADPLFMARAAHIAQTARSRFLLGEVNWKQDVRGKMLPYNSAVLLDANGKQVFVYDKIHLVAFGEYVPARRWLKFAEKLTAEVGDFAPGWEYRVGELAGGRKFGAFICFEAVFPDLVRRFASGGAELFVNISNDGWFGGTAAPAQHLMMARVRAVENRRWLLRGTNSGYTVSIDPYGRIAARLAPDVRGALHAPYDFRTDTTLYTRFGDWLAWLCVAASAFLFALFAWRR